MKAELSTIGAAFLREAKGSDGFSKLSRYESGLERIVHRALDELQRLQAARAGMNVPPPAMVDVDIAVGASVERREAQLPT